MYAFWPELAAVGVRLLEVVAEDLVELEEIPAVALEPFGEPLVQLRADGLRQRVVGRVANQHVAEAERVVTGEHGLVGTDELLPHERGQPRDHDRLLGNERLDGASVEHAAFDRPALEHGALGRLELVEPRGEQRLDRRRHRDVPVARLLHERDHLLDEQRVPLGRLPDPVDQACVDVAEAFDHRVRVFGTKRLEQHRRRVDLASRPAGAAVEELRPSGAQQQDRRVAREIGDVLDEVEERLLAPVDVVEHADHRPCGRDPLQQLAERVRDLLARRRHLLVAQQRGDRLRPDVLERGRRQLLRNLDDRPVRDPLPVGEAAPPQDHGVIARGEELEQQT